MESTEAKTFKQLANEYNVDPKTLKKEIKKRLPMLSAIWYAKGRKRLYYPNELELIYKELNGFKGIN